MRVDNANVFNVNSAHDITIEGRGLYGGTKTASYHLLQNDLADAEVSLKKTISPTTTLTDIENNLIVKWVGEENKVETNGYYIYVSSLSNLQVGDEVSITICGDENTCKGRITKRFTVSPTSLEGGNLNLTYNTQDFVPAISYKQYPVEVVYINTSNVKTVLTRDVDYTVDFVDCEANTAGKKTVAVTGIGKYATNEPIILTYIVNPLDLSDASIIFDYTSVTYDPNLQTQYYRVEKTVNGRRTIISEKYYTEEISGSAYDKEKEKFSVGTVTIKVKGNGDCIGEAEKSYEVTAKDIESDIACEELYPSYYYYHMPLQKPVIKDGDIILTEGKDYELSYSGDCIYEENDIKYTNVGRVNISISGVGNYYGIINKRYLVMSLDLNDTKIEIPSSSISYRPNNKNDMKLKPVITYSGHELKEGVDYTVSYLGLTSNSATNFIVGETVKVTIVAIEENGNCEGRKTKSYTIGGMDLKDAEVILPKVTYSPSLSFIMPTVKYDGVELTGGRSIYSNDYNVTFDGDFYNVTKKGVDLIIKANENLDTCIYKGSIKAHYDILPYAFTGNEIVTYGNQFKYDSSKKKYQIEYDPLRDSYQMPEKIEVMFDGTPVKLVKDKDYEITGVGDPTEIGTVKLVIVGKGNYSGRLEKEYEIVPVDLSKAVVTPVITEYKPEQLCEKPTVSFTFESGEKTLTEDDVVITCTDKDGNELSGYINAMKVNISITPKSSYFTGEKTYSYDISPMNISNATLSDSFETSMEYYPSIDKDKATLFSGKNIIEVISAKDNKIPVNTYTLISIYQNGVNVLFNGKLKAGEATVTLRGSGNYVGNKSFKYTITPKDISKCTYSLLDTQTYSKDISYSDQAVRDITQLLLEDIDYTRTIDKDFSVATSTLAYKVVYTYTGKGNYTGEHKESYFVNKAAKVPDAPESLEVAIKKDKTLKEVSINDDWAFVNPSTVISQTAGESITAEAEYINEDKNCYMSADNVFITVTTKACEHVANPDNVTTTMVEDKAATCTEEGLEHKVCNSCDYTIEENIVKRALGHSFNNYASNNDATCYKDGTKTSKCIRCNITDTKKDAGSAKGHSYTHYIFNNDATCMVNGTKTASCDNGCGEKDTVIANGTKTGHKYVSYSSDNNATCITDGTKSAFCIYGCGAINTVTDTGSATGIHRFESYSYNNDATCSDYGTKTATCENVGCNAKNTIEAPEYGFKNHVFSNYTYNDDETCFENGTETASCDYGCGETATRTVNETLGHVWDDGTVEVEPTNTKEGKKVYHCSRCSTTKNESIPKLEDEKDADPTDPTNPDIPADPSKPVNPDKPAPSEPTNVPDNIYKPVVSEPVNNGSNISYDITFVKGGKATIPDLKKEKIDGKLFKVTSSNKSIATVSNTGVVQGKKDGTCEITIQKLSGTYKLYVTVTTPKFIEKNYYVNNGEKVKCEFIGTDLEPTYTIANKKIATVDNKGVVTGLAYGKTKLTATVNGKKYTTNVQVYDPEIVGNDKVAVGKTLTLKVKQGSKVTTWSVLEGNATITEKGALKIDDYGDIQVQAINNGKTVTKTIKVLEPEIIGKTSVKVNKSTSLKIKNGLKNSTWSSSNPSVAIVDNKGKVTGVSTGTTTITAVNGNRVLTVNITVTN